MNNKFNYELTSQPQYESKYLGWATKIQNNRTNKTAKLVIWVEATNKDSFSVVDCQDGMFDYDDISSFTNRISVLDGKTKRLSNKQHILEHLVQQANQEITAITEREKQIAKENKPKQVRKPKKSRKAKQ